MFRNVSVNISMMTAAVVALLVPTNVSASEVELTFVDHELTIVGEYAGFLENTYIVTTASGTVYVPMDMVTCSGPACVTTGDQDA